MTKYTSCVSGTRSESRRLPPVDSSLGPDGLELLAIGFGEGGDGEAIEGFWTAET